MATTPLTLVTLVGIATLATIGMFVDLDAASQLVVSTVAAVVWAIAGNAALEVLVTPALNTTSQPVWGLVYVSAIMALATGVFALLFVFQVLGAESGATESGGLLGD